MNYINRLAVTLLIVCCTFTACDDLFELDYLDNPNAVSPDLASVDELYNNIQLEFRNIFFNFQNIGDAIARLNTQVAETYVAALPSTAGNGGWNNAYADLFPDINALEPLAAERGLDIHLGSAKVMQSYALTTLVDYFNDVPYTEALQGTDVISPTSDSGESVYAAAEALLDEAIALLEGTTATAPRVDNYYGGNAAGWLALAKTLKLRIYNNTRLVDANAGSKINSIIAGGDYIDEASEDFQFNYGSNRDNPNSRHPFYNNSYEASDGTYQNTYFMWLLYDEKGITDPRIRFYFYRQTNEAIGLSDNTYSCVYSRNPDPASTPAHYLAVDPNMPYCALPDGYYGRDAFNGQGIPPDGEIRTVYGVYPGGGQYDNNSYQETAQNGTTGALGQGIAPIMLSAWVDFMRAEAALTAGTGEDARALLESAVRKHIDKVLSFESRIPAAELNRVIASDPVTGEDVFASALLPDQEDVDAYVTVVLDNYDAATDKLDVVMKEYLISLYGNGIEGYNMYRRTGKPNNMQPGIQEGVGAFPRSILYPSDHVNLNASVSQKSGITEFVFWDDGSANPR